MVAGATTLRPGARVRCERTPPARGTWLRYAGRTGTVVSVNRQRSVGSPDHAELGVSFTDDRGHVDAWFVLTEVVTVDGAQATSTRLLDANASDAQVAP